MNAKALAEAYEKLKELRRQPDSNGDIASFINDLEAAHEEVAAPRDTEAAAATAPLAEELTRTIRMIATKTLAARVFGNSEKADAWMTRPSAQLSGQRPVDLLRDELGTDIVREMLERIDHGIFV